MKLIYTNGAKEKLEEFHKKQEKAIESIISEEKYIFGDDVIEITANDIDIASNRILILRREKNRNKILKLLSKIYFIIGLIIIALALSYPYLMEIIRTDTQKTLLAAGLSISIISTLIKMLVSERNREENYLDELKNRELKLKVEISRLNEKIIELQKK